jgi:hypothetical protein
MTLNYLGLLIGLVTFLIIGLFHPLVIKAEYYIGTKSWIIFCCAGIAATLMSIFTNMLEVSIIFGIIAFSCFWSILEVFQQAKRVEKGWFPSNPKRKKMFDK